MNMNRNYSILVLVYLMILNMAVLSVADNNKITKFIPDRDSKNATVLKFEVRYVYEPASTSSTHTAYITAEALGKGRDEIKVKCKPVKIKPGRNIVKLTMEYAGRELYEEGRSIKVIMYAGNENNVLAKDVFDYEKIWSKDPDFEGAENAFVEFMPMTDKETPNKLEFKVEYVNASQKDQDIYIYAYPVTPDGSEVPVKSTQMKINQRKGKAALVLEYAGKEPHAISNAIVVNMAVMDAKGRMHSFASTEFKYKKTWSGGEAWFDDGKSLPEIVEFKADRELIPRGTCTHLHWKVLRASRIFINKEQVYGDSKEVCPEESTNYIIRAENKAGAAQPARVMIRVVLK